MVININGKSFDIPTDLSQLSLGQFLQYWDAHGRELDKQLQEVLSKDFQDEFERELAVMEIELKEAIGWYSTFTGHDFSTIQGVDADLLLKHYRQVRSLILSSQDDAATTFPFIHEWNGETWVVSDWRVSPNSKLTFNELLTSKEITRQIYSLGKGKWDAMLYLCAVFFRKKDEPFSEALVSADSDRLKLMPNLPMTYAVQVAFFLTCSVGICNRIFQSSGAAVTAMPT